MRIVLADNARRGEPLRRILLGEGLTCDEGDVVRFEDLPARLAEVPAELVLVACDDADDAHDDAHEDACYQAIATAARVTTVPILATGRGDDDPRRQRAKRAGARDYLAVDRLREELSAALIKMEAELPAAGRRGRVVAVYSPNGGAGVSTTAINLATRLVRGKQTSQTALIDLNRAPTDLSLMLDIEPAHTVRHVCENWRRLDRQMLTACMTPHRSGICVLPQPGFPEGGGAVDCPLSREAVRQLITLSRRVFAYTVLDLDHDLDPPQVEAMRLADFTSLIVRPDVPGLRRARWALDTAEQLGVRRERFRLVLNRTGRRGQIKSGQVEQTLGVKIFQAIPDDERSVSRAINRGLPLAEVSRMSRINRGFSSLAKRVRSDKGSAAV